MSESKFVMAQKLHNVQLACMGKSIQDFSLDSLIPLIFKECSKEGLTFWFNFYENECVLNLRDIQHENYELNIRQYIGDSNLDSLSEIKSTVLINAFLITKENVSLYDDASSAENTVVETTQKEERIISSDKITPIPIRKAIEKIQSKGIEVNKEAIKNHVPWNQLSTDQRIKCTTYLNQMGASQ